MAKARGDYTDILLRKKIVGQDQLQEAENAASAQGLKLQDMLAKLGYATQTEVMTAIAEHHGMQFVDMSELEIPKAVIELVPESVARENLVLPLSLEGNTLKIITADPTNYDTIQKLQFILNKDIVPVLAVADQITEAINRNYGQTETESVDSMLVEFTDTAIEFTQTESMASMAAADDSDAPVVRLCNLIIQEAINLRASDIHIEPFADRVRV
ncbi:MAG TPA: type II/IV secretion system protein, partial [Gemmata sp.]|nr:type II/IV secretion system protein [Gemmata sp.]